MGKEKGMNIRGKDGDTEEYVKRERERKRGRERAQGRGDVTHALRAPPPLACPSSLVTITEATSTFSLKALA